MHMPRLRRKREVLDHQLKASVCVCPLTSCSTVLLYQMCYAIYLFSFLF